MGSASEVRVRRYAGGDETGIVDVWNRALPQDTIDLLTFSKQVLCDPNFDPAGLCVASAAGEIIGFALAIRRRIPLSGADLEPENGWITAFGVDPKWRRQGIGARLFDEAEGFLAAEGRKVVSVSPYAPNYFWPGIDKERYEPGFAFLESRGYQPLYEAVAMDTNLVGFEIPDDVRETLRERIAEGYRFERLTAARLYEVAEFASEKFNPDWGRAVREAVVAGLPWDQFFLAIAPSGRLVGFAMYGAYGGVQERFGPFGVDESERGKGIGKILLYQTLEAMRSRGLHGAWFLWTGRRSPAGRLYLRAGFTITRSFWVMRKELGGAAR